MRASTWAVWDTPRAAVGSSMITSLAWDITALATATDWRCPPESEATGWRIGAHGRDLELGQHLLGP